MTIYLPYLRFIITRPPIDLARLDRFNKLADQLLIHDGGRHCTRPLTAPEIRALGFRPP